MMKTLFRLPVDILGRKKSDNKNDGQHLKADKMTDITQTASVRRVFIVDFENVGIDGIGNADVLGLEDHVHLFCTRNSAKICPSVLAGFNSTNLLTHVVPQGDQSVDMHIVTYLGYLIAQKNPKDEFFIISKDKDYDNVIKFWKDEQGITVKRLERLIPDKKSVKSNESPNSAAGQLRQNQSSTVQLKQASSSSVQTKQASSSNVQSKQSLSSAGQPKQSSYTVQQKVSPSSGQLKQASSSAGQQKQPNTSIGQKNQKQPNTSSGQKKQKQASSGQNKQQTANKQTAQNPSADKKRIAQEKMHMNNAISKTLSQAKYDSSIIGFVSSQAVKHFSDTNRKQRVHGVIVQKYGQEKGLEIYKCIRQHL